MNEGDSLIFHLTLVDEGYASAGELFLRLVPSISNDALSLIIPYSAGTQFSEVVAASELPVFADVWVCVIEERQPTRASFNDSVNHVIDTLATGRARTVVAPYLGMPSDNSIVS